MGQSMTLDATTLTGVSFFIIILVPSFIAIGVISYLAIRFVPTMVKQMQQLTDNNAQLTKIAQQNATQFASTQSTLAAITPELVKQTHAIEDGNALIVTQGIDFRSYQTLVSDNLSHYGTQIDANTAKVDAALANVAQLQLTLAQLPAQIVLAVQNELDCESVLNEFRALRAEVTRAMFQQQRATGTFPSVPATTPTPSTPTP